MLCQQSYILTLLVLPLPITSNSQREFIMGQAKARGFKNVQVLTGILHIPYSTLLYSTR